MAGIAPTRCTPMRDKLQIYTSLLDGNKFHSLIEPITVSVIEVSLFLVFWIARIPLWDKKLSIGGPIKYFIMWKDALTVVVNLFFYIGVLSGSNGKTI